MAKGKGICPIMSNGSNVAVPCKGDKCQLWDKDGDQCSQKTMSYLVGICDELFEIRRTLTVLVKGEMSDRNDA